MVLGLEAQVALHVDGDGGRGPARELLDHLDVVADEGELPAWV